MRSHPLAVLISSLALLNPWLDIARATTFLELESTSMGDGWFRYRMSVKNDPFFSEADITSVGITFTNQIDQGTNSSEWINTPRSSDSLWSFNRNYPYPARPYEQTFLIRSSDTAYRMANVTNYEAATVLMSLYPNDFFPDDYTGVNIAAYVNLPCLIPCAPSEADGSPTNFVYQFKIVRDIELSRLIHTNSDIYGVSFLWDAESTFVLQGTRDFDNWTNIAYIWSYPPETVWTTNQPLNDFGQFFRVALVSGQHMTNLPPLNSGLTARQKAVAETHTSIVNSPRVIGCQPAGDGVLITIASQPHQTCLVQALNAQGAVWLRRQVRTKDASTAVRFDTALLPNPVFFQVAPP